MEIAGSRTPVNANPITQLGLLCVGLSIIGGVLSLQEDGSESSVNTFLCVMCCCTVLPLALWLVMAFLLFVLSLPSMIALSIPMIICNFLVPLGICFGVVLICYPCIMGGAVLTSKDGGAAGSANFITGMAAETLGPVVALFFQVVLCPSLFWYAGGISLWGDVFTSFWENNDFCFGTDENGNTCFPGFPELKFEMPTFEFDPSEFTEGPRVRVLCLVLFVAIPAAKIPFTLLFKFLTKAAAKADSKLQELPSRRT